jgi:hypothetical protein
MTHRPNKSLAPVADQRRLPPVRVKLWQADAKVAKVHPPDGEHENWWYRLNTAFGTDSNDFVNSSLLQLQAAARSPFGTISETHQCRSRYDRSCSAEKRDRGSAGRATGLHPHRNHGNSRQA